MAQVSSLPCTALNCLATFVALAQGTMLIGQKFRSDGIVPERTYSSSEVAELLGLTRPEVIALLKKHEIRGKLINGNYRILGRSIMDFLAS